MIKNEKQTPIYFDEQSYNQHLKEHQAMLETKKQMIKEFKKLLNSQLEPTNFENIVDEFYSCLELQKKEVNTMNLKGNKLASLLDINVSNLLALQSRYNLNTIVEPTTEQYTTYATTSEELEKYNICLEVIKAIDKAKKYTLSIGNLNTMTQAFSPMIGFNHLTQSFVPNVGFIKNNLRG